MTVYCDKCSGETRVLDSRLNTKGLLRRRRFCLNCGHRYSTFEVRANKFWELDAREEKLDKLQEDLAKILHPEN